MLGLELSSLESAAALLAARMFICQIIILRDAS